MKTPRIIQVRVHKAEPVVSPVPSVSIVIFKQMPRARTLERNRENHRRDAKKLSDALVASLPQGTLRELKDFLAKE